MSDNNKYFCEEIYKFREYELCLLYYNQRGIIGVK